VVLCSRVVIDGHAARVVTDGRGRAIAGECGYMFGVPNPKSPPSSFVRSSELAECPMPWSNESTAHSNNARGLDLRLLLINKQLMNSGSGAQRTAAGATTPAPTPDPGPSRPQVAPWSWR
jgi:hypothetical protein